MIEIKTYTKPEDVKEAASLARKHRLYVPRNWCMIHDLREAMQSPYYYKISLAFKNNVPVGVSLSNSGFVQTFVRKSERRKGIGTMVTKPLVNDRMYASEGLKKGQSEKFWEHVGVKFCRY